MSAEIDMKGVAGLTISENNVLSDATELFKPLVLENDVVDSREMVFRPINSGDPLEYNLPPHSTDYIQLQSARHELELKIVNEDGTDISTSVDVAPIPLIGNSIFRQIDVEIDGKLVSSLSKNNPGYTDKIQHDLSYQHATHAEASFYIQDEKLKADKLNSTDNKGFKTRQLLSDQSKSFHVVCFPAIDLFTTERFFPKNHSISLKFHRAKDEFSLCKASTVSGNFKIVIVSARLYITYLKLKDDVTSKHDQKMKSGSPGYLGFKRSVLRTIPFPKHQTHFYIPNAFSGSLPKHIIIALVPTAAYNGDYNQNPYLFKNHDLKYLDLKVNGVSTPATPYKPNFSTGKYMREYRALFDNLGIKLTNAGLSNMSGAVFANEKCYFPYDFSKDKTNAFYLRKAETGAIDVSMEFASENQTELTVLMFATYDSVLIVKDDELEFMANV